MSAKIISGNEVSQQLKDEMKEEVVKLKAQGLEPCLSVILVGEDPASKVYVANKKKACEYIGIKSLETKLPAEATMEQLLDVVEGYNKDKTVHGILCQLPLPKGRGFEETRILRSILPEKDVDCFHPYNVGLISIGEVRFLPCTPAGVLELIRPRRIPNRGRGRCYPGAQQHRGPSALQHARSKRQECHGNDVSHQDKGPQRTLPKCGHRHRGHWRTGVLQR